MRRIVIVMCSVASADDMVQTLFNIGWFDNITTVNGVVVAVFNGEQYPDAIIEAQFTLVFHGNNALKEATGNIITCPAV